MYEEEEQLPYSEIDAEEAKRLIEAGAHVIDVRQLDEWNGGHIAQATLVPIAGIYAFGKELAEQNLPKDEDVIFVCASGRRSASASEIARLLGFQKVYNLAHGMHGWIGYGLPATR
ncbi:rhodanese-like domain-containing protein [Ktedonobacter racemifer]|uniref:Rhodanese domain protein n=1 Tax=Ktedonobacter racemifer DSM 44963 TaxID=485913 RepID=D6TR63_KTERA|nr:rhodanese-like domain-containing protein [Ktedonobacter racemifer]EFH87762.1 Rhodanese domain protein [Ktedonobacter racemifer DSM 44963]